MRPDLPASRQVIRDESMDSGEGATDAAWRACLVYSKRQEAFPS